jgi:precorrin-3B C17-methyltransferase
MTRIVAGELLVVGLGPGPEQWRTPEVEDALTRATDLIGYKSYIERCPERQGQTRHVSDNRVELDRARHAISLVQEGRTVAVVSGGDPGVFAMAAAVFEALDADEAAREIIVTVMPGVSAMQAASARLGAPLGHDFCAISLSDNLKPWSLIERRLKAAADGDFVIALYNPASKTRPAQIFQAFDLLRMHKGGETPVAFARAVGRPDEKTIVTTLREADPATADMATLIIVGSSQTRLVQRPGAAPWIYTPRSVPDIAG